MSTRDRSLSWIATSAACAVIMAVATVCCAFERPDSGPRRVIDLGRLSIDFELVVKGLQQPVAVRHAGDGSGRLFVIEQPGRIRIVDDGSLVERPFLDITDRVRDSANEQGLLGLAFHPDYADNGRFFVNYTDLGGDTVVSEFTRSETDPNQAEISSEATILRFEQPYGNHNGGDIAFGPDGYLWIATGDGGGAGDPQGSGQDLETLLGKLLRIDVDRGSTYTIPPDNPFENDPNALDEIWAYGLRNPWRFSFDRGTGDLYIGDVGQNLLEEINFEPAPDPGGRNYGWNTMEGSSCFSGAECTRPELVLPVAEYDHSYGCSVTGGYVYRGSQFPAMFGFYLYGDYCSGNVWALSRSDSGEWVSEIVGEISARISSFGEDEDGELFLTGLSDGGLYRVTARAVPPAPRSPAGRVSAGSR
jgi:glucose/arabinose dehydrogenase